MKDFYQREIDYLRISVTTRCNLGCRYCMPAQRRETEEDVLSFAEIVEIVEAAAKLGVRKLRITGGEPLMRGRICQLCARLRAIDGIRELALTTNGQYLEGYAQPLKEAGVDRVNVSLDTLRPERYREMTRGGRITPVLQGIKAARKAGLAVKLNVVLVGGFNEDEIEDFVALTRETPLEVRFIELMPVGPGAAFPASAVVSCDEVLRRVPQLRSMGQTEGVARLYQLPEGAGRVGLISPVSCDFCAACNRVRLTARGTLKPCLHSDKEISLRGLAGQALERQIRAAIAEKPERRPEFRRGHASAGGRPMYLIGG